MPDKLISSPDYIAWLGELRSRIQSARISAARSVNRELILLYWDIRRGIVEKQEELGWGESVIERNSGDLRQAFPEAKGFSPRNLRDMKRLFSAYTNAEIWQQAVAKLPAKEVPASNRRQVVAKLPGTFLEQLVQEVLSPVLWGHLKKLNAVIGLPAKHPGGAKNEINPRTAQRHLKHFVSLGLLRRLGSGPATEYQVIQP